MNWSTYTRTVVHQLILHSIQAEIAQKTVVQFGRCPSCHMRIDPASGESYFPWKPAKYEIPPELPELRVVSIIGEHELGIKVRVRVPMNVFV